MGQTASEAEGLSLQESVIRQDNGWIRLRMPVPFSLKWVNTYLLPEDGGWTVVDPGLRTPEAEAFWEAALAASGIDWGQIVRIVLTHHHPDHYGMAGWLQRRTGAPVYLSPAAVHYAERMWGERETFSDELTEAFRLHGLPPELAERMNVYLRGTREQVLPAPEDAGPIRPGERLAMGGAEWEVLEGGGHAPGHLMFYDRASGRILCGDQVMPKITPNIGWTPNDDPDPLLSFMSSLRQLETLDANEAYPGHRDPFGNFTERVRELLEHHELRLRTIGEMYRESGPMSAFVCCERLFGVRLRNNPHNMRFAMAETIAHLVRLEREGALKRERRESETGVEIFFAWNRH
jgi:glyoxylase-like metal-dependent hydrolase (beta-lactamase superfamily II)